MRQDQKDEEINKLRSLLLDREDEIVELSVEYIYPLIKCLSEMVDWIAEETPEVKERALDIIQKTNKRLKLRGPKPI
jgi:hypothetical protein